jgi:general secretion pathway protein J
MRLLPEKQMSNVECRMDDSAHSSFVIRHSKAASRIIFDSRRRSPGRKALFSSIHPVPASWTASAGFTLIEVLLALAICAIVLVIVSSVFASALKLQERAGANLDRSLPIERALTVMRKDLKNAVAPGGMLAGPLQSGSLQGGVDANSGVQIYTTTGLITPNAPWGEIQRVTYGLQSPTDASANGKELVRTVTRNLLSTSTEDDEYQFLADGVENLSFYYFDGANWLESWDDTTQTNLPLAVRVNVQMAAADANAVRPEPIQLLVPLMVQVHTNQLDDTDDGSTNSAAGP